MNTKIITALVAVALIAVTGVVVFTRNSGSNEHMPMGSNSAHNSSASATAPADGNSVNIQNYKFNPTPLKVKKGTSVTWTNKDIAKHNVVVDDGQPAGGPSGPLFGKGETYKFTFSTVGTFKYHCEPHPYMHGEVVVTE